MAAPAAAASPTIAGCSIPTVFMPCCFDQRGCGRSRPKGSREHNTTAHLIADMEKIRENFGCDRWMVVGGSWGATLALAYAQAHPERVSGIALRATFLGTRAEVETAFTSRLSQFYPALYADFLSVLPVGERERPVDAYWRRILDADPAVHGPASRAWHDTERALSEHKAAKTRIDLASLNVWRTLPATPFMEAHYFVQDSFMSENQLLRNAGQLDGIPGIIVQGRYDLLCPPETSQALAKVWPGSEIRIVEEAGHSLYDAGVRDAVMKSIADLASKAAR
ncbi:proline iminopeptidase [Bradyrhizobium sp. LM3.6]